MGSAAAAPGDSTPVILESFAYKNSYYLALSDGSRFSLKAILLEKGGWFSPAKYGNPAAHWVINDRVAINRVEGFEFPFQLVNLETQEEALAAYYNPHMEGLENIQTLFQQIMDSFQKQNIELTVIKADLYAVKRVVDVIEDDTDANALHQMTDMLQKQSAELSAIRKELADLKNGINAKNHIPEAQAATPATAYGGTTTR